MRAVDQAEWERLQAELANRAKHTQQDVERIAEESRVAVRRAYNITTDEVLDVTDLYYRHEALTREADLLRSQIEKLDKEVNRMRQHIEHEPQRIAAAVEAAKVTIENKFDK